MKKAIILLSIVSLMWQSSSAQEKLFDISKGDYNLLKFDVLNLMGLGVQKLHLGFETSPMKQTQSNLPTIQFNVSIPFNSLSEDLDIDNGIEGGMELRFYLRKRNKVQLLAEGFYMGVALDGGYTKFTVNDEYYKEDYGLAGESLIKQQNHYDRTRTGISFLMGGQSKLADRLYFDANMGIGWSNVNVNLIEGSEDINGYGKNQTNISLFYLHFKDGKSQRFYMPLSFGIGYNFGRL